MARGVWTKGVEAPASPRKLLEKVFPPMLATLAEGLRDKPEDWFLEMKYDGFRATAAIVEGEIAMWTRNGLDLTARFPHVAEALKKLRVGSVVVDGEIVALDSAGAPRFQLLQQGDESPVIVLFDLLWLEGHDLRTQPLEARRDLLKRLVGRPSKTVRLAEQVELEPDKALALAARRGYEGLIAKRRGSVYENRRSKAWLKLRAINAQELAIVGYTPATNSNREIGALLLGVVEGKAFRYAGKVGTGFSSVQRRELLEALHPATSDSIPVEDPPRDRTAVWVKPELVAQVQFTEWTADGRLRHPSFLGLRPDKKPGECFRERPDPGLARPSSPLVVPSRKKGRPDARATRLPEVVLTKPERVLYPRDKITKQDLADYYDAVSEAMLHALEGRPIAMEHWNEGIDAPSWFHHDVGKDAEPWMTIADAPARTSKKTIRHLVIDRPETLRWLAQRSVLTTHMWSSRVSNLESPDWLVLDLDPAAGKGIEQAVEAALVLRKLFESMDLPSVPKTSGKRGIHVFVPLVNRYTHEEVAGFACRIAEAVAGQVSFATTARPLAARKGRLYLDCLQNGYGKTIIAPYSPRALDGAPVSAPLKWSEVTKKLDPLKFNLRTMPNRLAKLGDLFAEAVDGGVKLPKLR